MKRILFFVVTLLLLTLGAMFLNDRINVALSTASTGNSTYKTYRLFAQAPRPEVAILGSSRASQNYIPTELSPIAFNYGMDGSGMYETLMFLRQALRNPYPNPIIINLDPWGFHGVCEPSISGNYLLALNNPDVQAFLPKGRYTWEDRIPGLRFHGSLRSNLTFWLNERYGATKVNIEGATLQKFSRTPAEWELINGKIKDSTFSFDPSWRQLLDAHPATEAHPIIWVVSAVSPHWREHYSGEAAMNAFLEEQARRPHTYVINLFASTADYTEAEFVDPTHLNMQGAIRFTNQLKEALKTLPIDL